VAFLADLVIAGLEKLGEGEYPHYRRVVEHCYDYPPPYAQRWFGRRYYELARKPEWFANSLIANSALEGYGSTQVWAFSNRIGMEQYKRAIRQHALDESRHSTMFARMMGLVFPDIAIDDDTKARIKGLQPCYTPSRHPTTEPVPPEEVMPDDDVLDELIGIHLTETRALVLQYLLRPVLLHYAPSSSVRKLTAASDVLIRDEARHIGYTARIFEEQIEKGRGDFIASVFERRNQEFNETTMIEVEREKIEI
jgi:hypothetical protein